MAIRNAIKICLLLLVTLTSGYVIAEESDALKKAHTSAEKAKKLVPNKKCFKCHDDEDEKIWEYDDDIGGEIYIYVDPDKFEDSVHGDQYCVGCHENVKLSRGEHDERMGVTVGCVECHQEIWAEQQGSDDPKHQRLKVVLEEVESYMHSVHARPRIDDQTRTNAACQDCHDAHNIGTIGSIQRAEFRLDNPNVCGKCHEQQKQDYLTSIHGKSITEDQNAEAAVCSDCHTTHEIQSPKEDSTKLIITKNCGDCHEHSLKTYLQSYHGQVSNLGYAHTAKCYDCHDSHAIKKIDDPTSTVHDNNRLETCRTCHENAPVGFLSFHAHGHANDFERYPAIWIITRVMAVLIIVVFLFFWTHVVLWFYRELQDRIQGKAYTEPEYISEDTVYFRRFSFTWRVIHLLFAMSTMVLILSGSTLLFSHTEWAAFVMRMLGGPEMEAIIHRTAGVIWLSIFFVHILIAGFNTLIWNRRTFRWFGPTSMLPNWQDWHDMKAMFRWFFGYAERPSFDRWSYWQKFDYWAPFWGASVIGLSGLIMFAPEVSGQIVPGYMFNIALILHAEEALLATVFLFTVHFFNAHFRPDKFPMSTTIFTGAIPLEEFKHEHRLEYERLKENGTLERYLVKKPSRLVRTGSNILGAVLIVAGLTLLTLVLIGYLTMGHH